MNKFFNHYKHFNIKENILHRINEPNKERRRWDRRKKTNWSCGERERERESFELIRTHINLFNCRSIKANLSLT